MYALLCTVSTLYLPSKSSVYRFICICDVYSVVLQAFCSSAPPSFTTWGSHCGPSSHEGRQELFQSCCVVLEVLSYEASFMLSISVWQEQLSLVSNSPSCNKTLLCNCICLCRDRCNTCHLALILHSSPSLVVSIYNSL